MSDTTTPADGQAQAQRIGGGYARLLSGIVRDFGVSHDAAASIVARAGHWSTTCDACGTRYGPDGTCSTCEKAEPETPEAPVWLHSTDEERWSDYEEYPTREAAIAGAVHYHDLKEGDRFWVGRKAEMDLRQLALGAADASTIVQGLGEQAGEVVGEVSEEWPDASREDEADLEAALAETIAAWIERRGLVPSFYRLVNVTSHEAPAACAACEATQVIEPPGLLLDQLDGTGPEATAPAGGEE